MKKNFDDDGVDFIDAESYMGKETSSFKELVIRQVSRIAELGSTEMVGGYWQQKIIKDKVMDVYVPDKAESYMNAINTLHDLLLMEGLNDVKYMEEHKAVKALLTKLYNEYKDKLKNENVIAEYKKKKYLLIRKRFQILSKLLARLNYLSEQEFID